MRIKTIWPVITLALVVALAWAQPAPAQENPVTLDASLHFTPLAHTTGDIIERATEKVGVDFSAAYQLHRRMRVFGSLSPDYAAAGTTVRDRLNWTARYGVSLAATPQLTFEGGLERALGDWRHRCGDARGTFGAVRWSRGAFSFTPVRIVGCLDRRVEPHMISLPGATRLPDGVWLFDIATFAFRIDPDLF